MHEDRDKIAGVIRDLMGKRLDDVAEALSEEGSSWHARQLSSQAESVRDPKVLKRVKAVTKPVGDAVGKALSPGDPAIAEYMEKSPVLRQIFTPLGLAGMIGLGSFVAGAERAFEHNRVLGPLNEAQMRGETPMSDPFNTFVQRRQKMGSEKTAGALGKTIGGATDAFGDLLKLLTHRKSTKDVGGEVLQELMSRSGAGAQGVLPGVVSATELKHFDPTEIMNTATRMFDSGAEFNLQGNKLQRTVNEFSAPKAGIATGLGLAGAMVAGAADEPLEYIIQKNLFGVDDRVQAKDKYFQSLASSSGSNTATFINDLMTKALGGAANAAQRGAMSFSHDNMFQRALESDAMLQQATDAEQDMLRRAFSSMVRFAPDVATDEFAVKNFLREAMMASNGPDYGTLGNLARVNRSMTGD